MITNLNEHRDAVATMLQAGGTVTPEWHRLAKRWDTYTGLPEGPGEVVDLIAGDGDAAALAIARNTATLTDPAFLTARNAVNNQAAAGVLRLLQAEYAKTAQDNYAQVADQFDAAGARLGELMTTVGDPDVSSAQLLAKSKTVQTAWLDLAAAADYLDDLAPRLLLAANLARLLPRREPPQIAQLHIALALDTANAHVRRTWEAWENTGHGGRWAALHLQGTPIKAHRGGRVTAYPLPAPFEWRQVRVMTGDVAGIRQVQVDPHDPPHVIEAQLQAAAA